MTRLTTNDISDIAHGLESYDRELKQATGRSLLGIACHARGKDKTRVLQELKELTVHVIPITAGLGIIGDFCHTVSAILNFLGCDARVSDQTDTSGLAHAFETKADAVMMADDFRFVGINLATGRVTDNSRATGRIFAAALDLMAGGIENKPAMVMGCGPLGEAAAKYLIKKKAVPAFYDIQSSRAESLKNRLLPESKGTEIRVIKETPPPFSTIPYILEATPAAHTISLDLLGEKNRIAAPGVPSGVGAKDRPRLGNRLVHDKLELGVAAMAVDLILEQI